jgi:Lrp/AsnC family transcriptional regulator, leucine-responsive regulatory protein
VIVRFEGRVDPVALGRDVRARIDVSLQRETDRAAFERSIVEHEGVLDAVHLTGDSDYELTVDCSGSAGLDAFLSWIKTTFAISKTATRVVLRQVK